VVWWKKKWWNALYRGSDFIWCMNLLSEKKKTSSLFFCYYYSLFPLRSFVRTLLVLYLCWMLTNWIFIDNFSFIYFMVYKTKSKRSIQLKYIFSSSYIQLKHSQSFPLRKGFSLFLSTLTVDQIFNDLKDMNLFKMMKCFVQRVWFYLMHEFAFWKEENIFSLFLIYFYVFISSYFKL